MMAVNPSEGLGNPPDQAQILNYILTLLAAKTGQEPSSLDIYQEFITYGFDSVDAVEMSGELADWLGIPLEENLLWEHPSPKLLTAYLIEILS